jgi:serine/threonine protein kinase
MAGRRLSIVHRDVSPHNVMLGYDGTVKLLDFGVAMSAVTEHVETIIVGKWLYMSPEATMNGAIDHRSDLFSLGVILYLLCTGSMPFSGPDPKAIVKKIRAGQHKPLEELAPGVPPKLVTLVERLLSPSPTDRPQRGQEVVAELTEIVRQHGLERSSQNIADYLARVLPAEVTLPSREAHEPEARQAPIKIVRHYPTNSPTPATQRSGLIDISETFKKPSQDWPERRSSQIMTAPSPKPEPLAPRYPVMPRSRRDVAMSIIIVAMVGILLATLVYLADSSF